MTREIPRRRPAIPGEERLQLDLERPARSAGVAVVADIGVGVVRAVGARTPVAAISEKAIAPVPSTPAIADTARR